MTAPRWLVQGLGGVVGDGVGLPVADPVGVADGVGVPVGVVVTGGGGAFCAT